MDFVIVAGLIQTLGYFHLQQCIYIFYFLHVKGYSAKQLGATAIR